MLQEIRWLAVLVDLPMVPETVVREYRREEQKAWCADAAAKLEEFFLDGPMDLQDFARKKGLFVQLANVTNYTHALA